MLASTRFEQAIIRFAAAMLLCRASCGHIQMVIIKGRKCRYPRDAERLLPQNQIS